MDIDDQRAALRDLIRLMMERTGLDATSLARTAGIAPSTLTRFLNKPVKHLLTARTLAKLSEVSGVPAPFVGSVISPLQRQLLGVFADMSEAEQRMYLTMGLGVVRKQPPEEPPTPPKERAPPRPTPGGSVAKNEDIGDCPKVVRLARTPV